MTPRSLVGMTMGARKRRLRRESAILRANLPYLDDINVKLMLDPAVAFRRVRPLVDLQESYQLGQRLRPCPGCQECGVRRFTKPEGFFSDNTHYVEIRDNAKVRLWRLKHKPILWCSKCGPRSVPTKFYDLEYCVGMVERFEWIELTQPNLCDGSGVLPARSRKVRR